MTTRNQLISSVGYSLRVAKRLGTATAAVEHLEAALLSLLNAGRPKIERATTHLAEYLLASDAEQHSSERTVRLQWSLMPSVKPTRMISTAYLR